MQSGQRTNRTLEKTAFNAGDNLTAVQLEAGCAKLDWHSRFRGPLSPEERRVYANIGLKRFPRLWSGQRNPGE